MLNHRLDEGVVDKLRAAGRIAAAARALGAARMVPGALRREVCDTVEAEIERLGGHAAFPAQTSVNHVAAHDCPSPDDPRRYAEGDLAKLDLGVHVDGWVVDTAITVEVGRPDGCHPLVVAARAALEAAIAIAGPGVPVRRVSAAIDATIRGAASAPCATCAATVSGDTPCTARPRSRMSPTRARRRFARARPSPSSPSRQTARASSQN